MKTIFLILLLLVVGVFAVAFQASNNNPMEDQEKGAIMSKKPDNLLTATFAGGCF